MAERDVRERDILVASNEYAYVQDLTKGDIVLYVGPTKISLSNTERLVELKLERFAPMRGDEGNGVQPFVTASSAQYVVLENPVKDATVKPVKGNNSAVELLVGRRVVVPGPATFPLWPGQKARVVAGHELSEDQYLRLRVYDRVEGESAAIGTERIIKGSEVSFFIPRTGLEVIPDEKSGYVRNAVTLLDGQYCVLRGPRGRRRYERGPAVVFPEASEEFLVKNGVRVLAAWPLKRDRGLHVRVLQGFEAAEGEVVPAGRYEPGQARERRALVERQRLEARTAAFKEQMAALHPELVATLKTLGAQQFAASLTENLSPLAILGGESVADVAKRLLANLPLPLGGEG